MVFRQFTAYLDTPHQVRVELPYNLENTSPLTFTIKNSSNNFSLTLTTDSVQYKEGKTTYLLSISIALGFDDDYWILDQDRNRAELGYGHIVRQPIFDEKFDYPDKDLGAHYTPSSTSFKLWAPISKQVLLVLNEQSYTMNKKEKGIWHITVSGDWDGASYYYLHKVNGHWIEVHDSYAMSSQANSGHSIVINPAKLLQEKHRAETQIPIQEAIIYEMSVRDFSWQKEANFQYPGKFKGLTESPEVNQRKIGFHYLKELGITHVQLMPIYDFGSVDEEAPELLYNWGSDPVQYNVPEGSYASTPHDPYARIIELQETIESFHRANISVTMDVVYNHVYNLALFSFEKIVPGYCYRVNDKQERTNGTFCGNDIASERKMIQHYILHSLIHWVKLYGVDGFRFDLMGILDIDTMTKASKELKNLYPNIYLYGEGWKMDTGLPAEELAHQYNAFQLPDYAFFSDDFRNTIKESLASPEKLKEAAFRQQIEQVLTGNCGYRSPAHFLSSRQALNYIECHDDATCFDYLQRKNPDAPTEGLFKQCRLGLQLVLLSQGIAFLHSGQEFFRTKQGVENSYNLPDSINQLDWKQSLKHQETIHFVKELIHLRKSTALFSLENPEKIKSSIQLDWLSSTLLRYRITSNHKQITIVINFSPDTTFYQNAGEKLIASYPYFFENGKSLSNIHIDSQSLIILES